MIHQTEQEWFEQGLKLFGADHWNWVFICPRCQTEQTALDFKIHAKMEQEQIAAQIGFSCIGRSIKGRGCDWTLGGLFKIHEKILDNKNPVFLFKGEMPIVESTEQN